ncbi:MAG TPA: hypothetical protein VHX42_01255 [Candidatus Babeliales bacterium]|nr:hypothetical protein [Candidatus Babeliales bacterium]
MEFVKFFLDKNYGDYSSQHASNIEMCILGNFLTSDVGYYPLSYIEYVFNDWEEYTSSNVTALEKENGYILLTDLYSEEEMPTALKMTRDQFVQMLTEWEEKVLKKKPKEVIIKCEDEQFIIETKD